MSGGAPVWEQAEGQEQKLKSVKEKGVDKWKEEGRIGQNEQTYLLQMDNCLGLQRSQASSFSWFVIRRLR